MRTKSPDGEFYDKIIKRNSYPRSDLLVIMEPLEGIRMCTKSMYVLRSW